MNKNTKPLEGHRVLDLTNVLSGPFCCHQLAHLGAEVIKVEIPNGGDLARQLGADAELNEKFMGVSFLAQNAGKKSLTLNLKTEKGREIFKQLIGEFDVLVENFRPGVMTRLGLGYETLKTINPRLIYCAISGFGQEGELKDLPAYDQIIQGFSGVMSITGDTNTAPYRVGYPISDTIGGITAAFAICAALAGRNNNDNKNKGEGCFLDVSMLEATLATMGWAVSNYLIAGVAPNPMGNQNVTACPSGAFKAADGMLNIAANKQQQFESVCQIINREDLINDERFANRQSRLNNRVLLNHEIEAILQTKSVDHWLDLLNQAGVPAGPVLSVADALNLSQIRERGLIGEFINPTGIDKDISVLCSAVKINQQAPKVDNPPPTLGKHTVKILTQMGYNIDEIEQLQQSGVI